MGTILISGGRIIDPSQNIDREGSLLIRAGKVVGIDVPLSPEDLIENQIDARGLIVCPGLIDTHVSLREPGNEDDETTFSGTAAALAGGFSSVACMPDTSPVVDTRAAAEFILLQAERARHCNVFPLGAVTKQHAGEELAEIGQLVEAGAVGFTDAKTPLANAEIMRRALEYTRMFDKPIFNHPQVPELVADGVMHEGYHSMLLGLRGMPAAAEDVMVGRDLALTELTGGRLHLMCISTRHAVEQIAHAKAEGLHVTCEVTPHQLALTDECLRSFDANYKVDPPLRTQEHINALIAGLKDGTIDAICSDHQPYSEEKKAIELDAAPFGIIGLETLLPVCIKTLIEPVHLTWPELIAKLTLGPAKVLRIDKGTLKPGADGDVTLIDPNVEWTIEAAKFRSQSRNTPFDGWTVKGRAHTVIVHGQVRYQLSE